MGVLSLRRGSAVVDDLKLHIMASICHPLNDNVFGPVVNECRSNFDFTLLFEQSILSIGPAALLLLLAPLRFVKLLKASKKTTPSTLKLSKSVGKDLPVTRSNADAR